MAVVLGKGVFDDGVALVRTEDDADGRVVALVHFLAGVVVDVHLHLPDVLMGEIARFEVDEDEAFQDIVIEHEVDMKVAPVEVDVLLPCNEGEPAPKFQKEFLQVVDERLFEVGLVKTRALLHAQKFKNVGIADNIFGQFCGFARGRVRDDGVIVMTCEQSLIGEGIDLPFELTGTPIRFGAFVHIKLPRLLIFDAHNEAVVRPTQLVTQCVTIWERKVKLPHIF